MDMVSLIVAALLAGAQPAADPYAASIAEAAKRFDVPERWIRAVMRVESAGDPGATSRAGAMGLMQLMPVTWATMRARYRLGSDPYAPRDNILAGTAYLREMYDRYGSPAFLAAYNAGPGRLDDHLHEGRPLPAETRRYLAAIGPALGGGDVAREAVAALPAPPPETLFAVQRQTSTTPVSASPEPRGNGLFAIRKAAAPTLLVASDVQPD
jgi:soluble lytic murein transglycosylase-like protein